MAGLLGVATRGLAMDAIKQLISGLEGSDVLLGFTRSPTVATHDRATDADAEVRSSLVDATGDAAKVRYQAQVTRTVTPLDDVQVSVYQDVMAAIKGIMHARDGAASYQMLHLRQQHALVNPPVIHRAFLNLLSRLSDLHAALLRRPAISLPGVSGRAGGERHAETQTMDVGGAGRARASLVSDLPNVEAPIDGLQLVEPPKSLRPRTALVLQPGSPREMPPVDTHGVVLSESLAVVSAFLSSPCKHL